MSKALLVAISMAITVNASQTAPPRLVTLRDLTVPAERLPAGCALSSTPVIQSDGGRVKLVSWEFPTNPWIGTDRRLEASISELVDGPAIVPDGPPLGATERSRYLGHLADGVEEAYGALYVQSGADAVTVRALKRAAGATPSASGPSRVKRAANPGPTRVTIGPIVAIVTGEGECFRAVRAHLESLAHSGSGDAR